MNDDNWKYKIYLLGCKNVPDHSRYLWNLLASLPLLFHCVLPSQRDCEIRVHRGDLSFILLAGNGKYDGQSCHLLLDEHKVQIETWILNNITNRYHILLQRLTRFNFLNWTLGFVSISSGYWCFYRDFFAAKILEKNGKVGVLGTVHQCRLGT